MNLQYSLEPSAHSLIGMSLFPVEQDTHIHVPVTYNAITRLYM